jgi:hypothetical protein
MGNTDFAALKVASQPKNLGCRTPGVIRHVLVHDLSTSILLPQKLLMDTPERASRVYKAPKSLHGKAM